GEEVAGQDLAEDSGVGVDVDFLGYVRVEGRLAHAGHFSHDLPPSFRGKEEQVSDRRHHEDSQDEGRADELIAINRNRPERPPADAFDYEHEDLAPVEGGDGQEIHY